MLRPCSPHASHAFVAALLALVSVAAQATPDESADAVTRLLIERRLIPPPLSGSVEPDLTQRMRHKASELVVSALAFLGVPYRRGGSNADTGFDCSGFTRHVFEHSLGLLLPRRVDEQAHAAGLQEVRRDELQPGDLVFFNTLRRTFSHVGIYLGEGKFIHAPRPGAQVRVEDMRFTYWNRRFTGARRADTGGLAPSAEASGH